MTTPRSLVVERGVTGVYHCINRCVRRAFLCGDGFDHRRDWIQQRLRELAGIFALDVGGYAVMSNHLHVVLRVDPDRARRWSSEEIARRWLRLFPPPGAAVTDDGGAPDDVVAQLAEDSARIAVLRERLSDLSWFMRCLSERIARRANREDDCTGRFWEGRFKCHRLLDDAAVLACMVYVDLNVIRAGRAETPEKSEHTSVRDRIRARRYLRRLRSRRSGAAASSFAGSLLPRLKPGRTPRHDEDGIWLARIQRRPVVGSGNELQGMLPLTLAQYIELVDTTGRRLRAGKNGTIPKHLQPILSRLELEETTWGKCVGRVGKMVGTVIGTAASRAREAARRDSRWVVGAMPL